MQNFNLLSASAKRESRPAQARHERPAMEEFLLAAEYIMARGNTQVILCERGIRTFEEYVRNTLPLAIVPELQREPPARRRRPQPRHGQEPPRRTDEPGIRRRRRWTA